MQIELFQPDMLANPYPTYARLRREDPVHFHEPFAAWILSRYDDIRAAFTDPRLSSSRAEPMEEMVPDADLKPFFSFLKGRMDFVDAARHTHLRELVGKAFTPHAVVRLTVRIESLVDGMLDAVEARGRMDVIADLAGPLPGKVITALLGVPPDDFKTLKHFSDEFISFFRTVPSDATADDYRRSYRAVQELWTYFRSHIDSGQRAGDEGLLTALASSTVEGTKLTEEELMTNATLILHAGLETTTNLIGNGLLALLRFPEQMARLRDDPALMPTAVEEMMRYDPAVQFTYRVAIDDFELHGKSIRKGQIVHLLLAAGNRDDAHFVDADQLDVGRDPNRHLSFGWGPHFCLGAPLARLEASIALRKLLARFPDLQLEGAPQFAENYVLRGLKALEIRWGAP